MRGNERKSGKGRGRARDAYDIGETLAAQGDRRRAATFFRHAVVGEDASVLRRVKLAGGAAFHLIRGAHDGGDVLDDPRGAAVPAAGPTSG